MGRAGLPSVGSAYGLRYSQSPSRFKPAFFMAVPQAPTNSKETPCGHCNHHGMKGRRFVMKRQPCNNMAYGN